MPRSSQIWVPGGTGFRCQKIAVIGLHVGDSCEIDLSRTDPKDQKNLHEVWPPRCSVKNGRLFSDEITPKLKGISISVSHFVFGRVSNLGVGSAVNLEQFSAVRRRWISLPLWSLIVCLWFPDSVLLYLCDQLVPRVMTTFSLMWLPCFAKWCSCPGRAVLLPERRENCIPFVKGSAFPCLQKEAEPTLKMCRLYIYLLSHVERKAEELRRPKSHSLRKHQSRVEADIVGPEAARSSPYLSVQIPERT